MAMEFADNRPGVGRGWWLLLWPCQV